ncbi:MAG: hypothetical protein ACI4FX_09550 [Agathobacter sp.]
MFVFLASFIIFVLILNYFIHKSNNSRQDSEDSFWDREQKANFTRRKDISNLNYITIPPEIIPENLHTDSEKKLKELTTQKMLNLTGMTNTDLKLQYGAANLEALSEYDNHFTTFVQTVPVYAKELTEAGQTKEAQALLEFAVSCRADSRSIFTQLADLYRQSGQADLIHGLIDSAEKLPSLDGPVIAEKLKAYLP